MQEARLKIAAKNTLNKTLMNKEERKSVAPIQYIVDACAKRQLYFLAAFTKTSPEFFGAGTAIFVVFQIPQALHPVVFWLRIAVLVLSSILWVIIFYEAYISTKP